MNTQIDPKRQKFNNRSRLIALFALSLPLITLLLLIYRFTLPTDGWTAAEPENFVDAGLIYEQNVMGALSDLQPGDRVTAINGVPATTDPFFASPDLRAAWRAGNVVQYSVQRDGQALLIDVPLIHWDAAYYLRTVLLSDIVFVVSLLGIALFVAVSYYAFWRRPNNPASRELLLIATLFFSLVLLLDILPQTFTERINPPANLTIGIIIISTFTLLLPPAFIRFGLTFPQPKPILSKRPWIAYLPFGVGLFVVAAFLLQIYVAGWIWTGISVLIAVILLLHNAITMRDTVSRGQVRWALGGTIIGLGLFSLTYVNVFFVESSASLVGQLFYALSGLGFVVMGIGLAVAVLRFHLFDIDLIVNRTLVYGALTIALIIIYVLVVGYLSFLLQTEANLAISLAATGLVAVLFGRLRSWLQRGVNRLMYGRRDEPYQVLAALGQQLENALEPETALSKTAESVALALKCPYAAVTLQQESGLQTAAAYGRPQNEIHRFPLLYAGQDIGELAVASRAPGEAFTPADRRLLQDLARQISVAAHSVLLSANLEQARLRLVTERGEARRKLGSDLHDGVGHQLVGLNRRLERAISELDKDPAQSQAALTDINQQLIALTRHVRDLAHQLYPPELELLGLSGALQERAQTNGAVRVQVTVPNRLPRLPAEIETAAYYIALESLTNVEKHAKANMCQIRLALEETPSALQTAVLQLDIRDDGRGSEPSANGGLGQLSMKARASEVGGTCIIESNLGQGTAVIVRIPCSPLMEQNSNGDNSRSYR